MNHELGFQAQPLASTDVFPEFETLDLEIANGWQSESKAERPYCFYNRAGDCVTLWGTDPNDAVSPWRLRNWQNPKWSIIGMKYCGPGRCRCRTIFDPTARCPAIEKETSDLDEREILTTNAADSWLGEASAGPTPKPGVLTYTTSDVIDKRISVPAQHSLVRLSKNPATNSDAIGMLTEVKAGRLAGIYCVNWEPAAIRARRHGSTWWTVIPQGEDGVLMLDSDDPITGAPLVAFRRELDPRKEGCGTLKTDKSVVPLRERLDAALIRAWHAYLAVKTGRITPCGGSLDSMWKPSGQPTVPRTCQRASAAYPCPSPAATSSVNLVTQSRAAPSPCPVVAAKLCFYQDCEDKPEDRNGFRNLAATQARRICAVAAPSDPCGQVIVDDNYKVFRKLVVGSTAYRTGKDIIFHIKRAHECTHTKVNQVHIYSHSGPEGVYSYTWTVYDGLYAENAARLDPCLARATTVAQLPFASIADNVVFVLYGCDTAKQSNRYNPNFAQSLISVLLRNGKYAARVYAHPDKGTTGGAGGNNNWVEFCQRHPKGRRLPRTWRLDRNLTPYAGCYD